MRFPAGLYGVTPDWDDASRLEDAIRQAAAGGMTALQWRHKTCPASRKPALAERLLTVCRALALPLIINDDWQLAQAIGADGVHLGRDDASPAAVRQALGPGMLIGASCYGELERAQRMLELDVDYIAFGAMYASTTKPQAPSAPHSLLTQAHQQVISRMARPSQRAAVVAIGGITVANASPLFAAGADSVAVVGGLFLQDDIERAARQFCQAWRQASRAT